MGITYGRLLLYHGVSEGNTNKEISMREYNNKKVYKCFNNLFTYDFGIPDLNLPPITIDDRPHLYKITRYTPDLLPAVIYVSFENYVCNFIKHSDSPEVLVINSDGNKPQHSMKKDKT